jgi:hypothetical protein
MDKIVFTVGGNDVNLTFPIDIEGLTISDFQAKVEKKIIELKNTDKLQTQFGMSSLIVGTKDLLKVRDKDDMLDDHLGILSRPLTFKVNMIPVGGSRRRSRKARKSRRSRKSRR